MMICKSCTQLLARHSIAFTSFRAISTSTSYAYPKSPPRATSTSAAQPFSTPFTPSPSKTPAIPPNADSTRLGGTPISSVPAGTPLKGLGYIKGQEAPLAKDDSEYPKWLWGLLGSRDKGSDAGSAVGDAFAKSKKQRRLASKAARALKTGSQPASHVVKVPLEEQSIDLPAGMSLNESLKAQDAREELNGAMRTARRKKIKEANFLRGMR